MKYRVVKAWSHDYLEDRVNIKLREGWKLLGGVDVTEIGHGTQYTQAMIKHDEVKVNVQEPIAQSIRDLSEFLDKHVR